MDASYELTRLQDSGRFYAKMRIKRFLFRIIGELYVGRRVKLAYFHRWLCRIQLPRHVRILEVGSGDGCFTFSIAEALKDARVLGLELNRVEAQVCKMIAQREHISNLDFITGNINARRFINEFDFVYCLDVLEHITDDVNALASMYAALKDGGHVLIHVPNRFYMETDGRLLTVPDEEAWKVNPGHVRQGYSPGELSTKLEHVGFEVRHIEQTQAKAIAYANKLHARVASVPPLRIMILPLIDLLTWIDMRKTPAHGNTVWAWAQKPVAHA